MNIHEKIRRFAAREGLSIEAARKEMGRRGAAAREARRRKQETLNNVRLPYSDR